jgi:hypothetical protein
MAEPLISSWPVVCGRAEPWPWACCKRCHRNQPAGAHRADCGHRQLSGTVAIACKNSIEAARAVAAARPSIQAVGAAQADLLVMGGYGHSRVRN